MAYDSAERRQAMAAGLEGKADAETIRARMVADTSQARQPPRSGTSRVSSCRFAAAAVRWATVRPLRSRPVGQRAQCGTRSLGSLGEFTLLAETGY